MGRKSQVDKFKSRQSKKSVDEEAINTRSYQKSQEELNRYGAEGVGELMKHGNIKEAAVVFSYEGMGAFASMFGNSMESAVINVLDKHMDKITQTMEQRIESIVEARMLEMMEGMTEGMKKFQAEQKATVESPIPSGFLEKAIDTYTKEIMAEKSVQESPVEIPMIDWEKAYAIDEAEKKAKAGKKVRPRPMIADAPRPKKSDYFSDISMDGIESLPTLNHSSGYRYGQKKEDIEKVSIYILSIFKKYEGIELRSADVINVLKKEYDIRLVNPTVTFRKIMSIDANLENTGFGVYKYEEKSFKPTV